MVRFLFIINFTIIAILAVGTFFFYNLFKQEKTVKIESKKSFENLIKLNNNLTQKLETLENRLNFIQIKFSSIKNYYHRLKNIIDYKDISQKPSIGGITREGVNKKYKVDFDLLYKDSNLFTLSLDREIYQNFKPALLDAFETIVLDEIKKLNNSFLSNYGTIFEQSDLLLSTPSIWPARGWISSEFGPRTDPFTQVTKYHEGLDIANMPGYPVKASANGVVTYSGERGGYGNVIMIDHGYNMQTRYAHLQRSIVKKKQKVKKGEVIGYLGNSGRSSGPHLHYEVRKNGIPVNPRKYILE